MLTFKFYPKLDKDCTEKASIAQKRKFFIKDLFFIRKKLDMFKFIKENLNRKTFFPVLCRFWF